MDVEGYCRKCNKPFDGHWDKFPDRRPIGTIFAPRCPSCGSAEVQITTDESNDQESPRGDDEADLSDEL